MAAAKVPSSDWLPTTTTPRNPATREIARRTGASCSRHHGAKTRRLAGMPQNTQHRAGARSHRLDENAAQRQKHANYSGDQQSAHHVATGDEEPEESTGEDGYLPPPLEGES